jgi:hypothetical protein
LVFLPPAPVSHIIQHSASFCFFFFKLHHSNYLSCCYAWSNRIVTSCRFVLDQWNHLDFTLSVLCIFCIFIRELSKSAAGQILVLSLCGTEDKSQCCCVICYRTHQVLQKAPETRQKWKHKSQWILSVSSQSFVVRPRRNHKLHSWLEQYWKND